MCSCPPTRLLYTTWRPAGSSSPTPCVATRVDRWSWRCTMMLGTKYNHWLISTRPEVKKIALANPATAPYGKAGKQALENAGLWDQLQPKIVIAESVRQALLYVQKGDAEAALVGRAIANVPEVRPVEVDTQLYDPIIQALGIVAASRRSADAERVCPFRRGWRGTANPEGVRI